MPAASLATSWSVSEPYAPRPIRFHGVHGVNGWRIKVYSIIYGPEPLDWDIYEPGLEMAFDMLPEPAVTRERPGVGYVICHRGRGVHYLVLGWLGQ